MASYILVFLIFFKTDYLLLAFILYRIVGIILYLITNNTAWFIPFFDFIKEYLLYNYLFKTNKYIIIFIILKMIYEYFNYSILNSRYHDNKVDILEKGIILVWNISMKYYLTYLFDLENESTINIINIPKNAYNIKSSKIEFVL